MSQKTAQPKKMLVIVGPTGTGKTSLGICLAEKFAGEIVSADSRQVYRGMDIGTGKEINKQINKFQINKSISNTKFQIGYFVVDRAKIWLYDLVDPDYRFSVADYLEAADAVIRDIWRRGKLPIIVGGTGFYIKALLEKIGSVGIKPDWKLREKLSSYSAIKLSGLLKKADADRYRRMNESDRQNPRRLIRAIEIAKNTKNTGGGTPGVDVVGTLPVWEKTQSGVFVIGLKTSPPFLYQKIDYRVDERVKAGIVGEIKDLLSKGFNFSNSALGSTIGYKEWQPYFQDPKIRRSQDPKTKIINSAIQAWKYHEHAYARRQMTWFRKMESIHWFDIGQKNWQSSVEGLAGRWYNDS